VIKKIGRRQSDQKLQDSEKRKLPRQECLLTQADSEKEDSKGMGSLEKKGKRVEE